jgi:DNA transposition AAA+ family ATPase
MSNAIDKLSEERKQSITTDLRSYVETRAQGSANKASKMLDRISNAYISHILNGKWEGITDEFWRHIEKQVSGPKDWVTVDTTASRTLKQLFEDAQQYANVYGITAEAGTGKSSACKSYAANPDVFLVSCSEFYNRKSFLEDLLATMGQSSNGYTVGEMMAHVINHVRRRENPLIILDEADKLCDQVLYFFITMYNMLEDKCGIVLLATDFLEKRVHRGLRLNKKGYKEIYSRLGRKFIGIKALSRADMQQVIIANGISDPMEINQIINGADGDLRRVKRLVHAAKRRGGVS